MFYLYLDESGDLGFDKILKAKQKDPYAAPYALERRIDKMVYDLYGLTPEEIAIVEGKNNH